MSDPTYNPHDPVGYLNSLSQRLGSGWRPDSWKALHQANPMQSVIDRERYVRDQRSAQIQLTRLSGRVQTSGAGEALVDINFPIMFAEKPAFSFGGELGDNQPLVDTSFPTVSAVVHSWVTEGEVALRYRGAKVAVVTTGPTEMQMTVLLHFEAKAFQNPIDSTANIAQPSTPQAAPPVEHPPGEAC